MSLGLKYVDPDSVLNGQARLNFLVQDKCWTPNRKALDLHGAWEASCPEVSMDVRPRATFTVRSSAELVLSGTYTPLPNWKWRVLGLAGDRSPVKAVDLHYIICSSIRQSLGYGGPEDSSLSHMLVAARKAVHCLCLSRIAKSFQEIGPEDAMGVFAEALAGNVHFA